MLSIENIIPNIGVFEKTFYYFGFIFAFPNLYEKPLGFYISDI